MSLSPHQDDLLKALQLEELSPTDQESILLEMEDLITQGTMIRLIALMDEPTLTQFQKLLDTEASEEQIDGFIKQHVPDADKALQDTIEELRDDILATTSKEHVE